MKVLLTGASGFLGAWVARALVEAGHSPRLLVRRASSLAALSDLDVEYVTGDVLDRRSVERAMEGTSAVIHAAGKVGAGGDPARYRVNVEGTRNVLEAARARGLRAIHTSSIGVIGATYQPVVLNEASPFATPGHGFTYVASKRRAEEVALSLAADGLDVVILNPGFLLGPGDVYFTSTQVVLNYLRGISYVHPRGGISFCDARDVAAACVAALSRGRRGERYIVAGDNLSYQQFFAELSRLTGLQRTFPLLWPVAEAFSLFSGTAAMLAPHPFEEAAVALRYGQLFNFCDSQKARHELGYRTRPLSSTLRDTIADHIARGAARAITPRLRSLCGERGC